MPLGEASREAQQQDLANVLHEVEVLGSTDPAAQQQLLRSLQRSKPELWPLVVQQFQASLTYHQQLVGQQQAGAPSRVVSVEQLPQSGEALMWPSEWTPIMQANYESSPDAAAPAPVVQPALPSASPAPATGPEAVPLEEPRAPTDADPPTVTRAYEESEDTQESDLLELRQLTFCQNVHGYGAYETYDEAQFSPTEQVSLYVEVGNYSSEPCEGGFMTKLAAGYQILDDHGQRVDGGPFPDVVDLCRSRRRDFHIQYGLVLPETIAPGKYQLRLTMRDLQSDKVGQEKIAFEIGSREP